MSEDRYDEARETISNIQNELMCTDDPFYTLEVIEDMIADFRKEDHEDRD